MDDGYGLRVEGEGGAIASGVEGGFGKDRGEYYGNNATLA
jgi:hypothetical protein